MRSYKENIMEIFERFRKERFSYKFFFKSFLSQNIFRRMKSHDDLMRRSSLDLILWKISKNIWVLGPKVSKAKPDMVRISKILKNAHRTNVRGHKAFGFSVTFFGQKSF